MNCKLTACILLKSQNKHLQFSSNKSPAYELMEKTDWSPHSQSVPTSPTSIHKSGLSKFHLIMDVIVVLNL